MKASIFRSLVPVIGALLLLSGLSCQKKKDDPGNTGYELTGQLDETVTDALALIRVKIEQQGIYNITETGICVDESASPSIEHKKIVYKPSRNEPQEQYALTIDGLEADKTYYARPYLIDNFGAVSYGNILEIKTKKGPATDLETLEAQEITDVTFRTGGKYARPEGSAEVMMNGVCWSLNPNPEFPKDAYGIADIGEEYSVLVGNLQAEKKYYVRAFVKSHQGKPIYGNEITVTTKAAIPWNVTVATSAITNLTTTGAVSGGTVTGTGHLVAKGICWGLNSAPAYVPDSTLNGKEFGSFTAAMKNLREGVRYYVRAYAISSRMQVVYGNELSFTTLRTPPSVTITTAAASNITFNTATLGGSTSGADAVSSRGICYGTSRQPTVANTVLQGSGTTGAFTVNASGLQQGTTYYARAYANAKGQTVYGNEVSFTTPSVAAVTTDVPSSIGSNAAVCGGMVTGTETVTARGVCWSSTSSQPTINDAKTTNGAGAGAFSSSVTGLNPGTQYYIRAYIVVGGVARYGAARLFYTIPTVTTSNATNIEGTSAIVGGNVVAGVSNLSKGVCYHTSPNPTIDNAKQVSASATGGQMSFNLYPLANGTTYYARAYATINGVTTYGNQISFKTIQWADVTTAAASNVSENAATCGGTASGTETIIARGVCWSTSQHPVISGPKTNDGAGAGNFVSQITGLQPLTTYYIRAYVTTSRGTTYGQQVTITTLKNFTVTTKPVTDVGMFSGRLNASITGTGSFSGGVCWSTSPNPTNVPASSISGRTGDFNVFLNGRLLPGTTYYVRAFGMVSGNAATLTYGNEVSFTTAALPALTTTTPGFTRNSVSSGGTMSHSNEVMTQGIIVSLVPNVDYNAGGLQAVGTLSNNSYSCVVGGLSPNTTYYVRSFAVYNQGAYVHYGNSIAFKTLP